MSDWLDPLRHEGVMPIDPEVLGITPDDRAYLTADVEAYQREVSGKARRRKTFLANLNKNRMLSADHPSIRIGQALLPLAAQYFGEGAQFYRGDLFVTLPVAPETPRFMSQKWHRDAEADTLFKLFMYLSDVTVDHAPFEYVRGSSLGRLTNLCPMRQYAPDALDPLGVQIMCGRSGTAFFADTGGIHRGGYSTSGSRLFAMWTYLRCREGRGSLVQVA